MDQLPPELLQHIFSFVSRLGPERLATLFACSRVSRRWHHLASPFLWSTPRISATLLKLLEFPPLSGSSSSSETQGSSEIHTSIQSTEKSTKASDILLDPRRHLTHIRSLCFSSGRDIPLPVALALVQCCPRVEQIQLRYFLNSTDAKALIPMAMSNRQLKRISLRRCFFNLNIVEVLIAFGKHCPQLERLELTGCDISLSNCNFDRFTTTTTTTITSIEPKEEQEDSNRCQLKHLDFSNNASLKTSILTPIVSLFPTLTSIRLSQCPHIDDVAFLHIAKVCGKQLLVLDAVATNISSVGLMAISHCHNLRELKLGSSDYPMGGAFQDLSDVSIRCVLACTKLEGCTEIRLPPKHHHQQPSSSWDQVQLTDFRDDPTRNHRDRYSVLSRGGHKTSVTTVTTATTATTCTSTSTSNTTTMDVKGSESEVQRNCLLTLMLRCRRLQWLDASMIPSLQESNMEDFYDDGDDKSTKSRGAYHFLCSESRLFHARWQRDELLSLRGRLAVQVQ